MDGRFTRHPSPDEQLDDISEADEAKLLFTQTLSSLMIYITTHTHNVTSGQGHSQMLWQSEDIWEEQRTLERGRRMGGCLNHVWYHCNTLLSALLLSAHINRCLGE